MNMKELLRYWRKVKETIHVFDGIIVRYVVQWSAVLLGMIGASAVVYPDSSVISGLISLTTIVVSFPIAIKCYFYYELLEEALSLGLDIEKLIFKGEEETFGLTHRLCAVSTRKYLGMTFFGWVIFLPFVILFDLSLTLALFYFSVVKTPLEITLTLFAILGCTAFVLFGLGFLFSLKTEHASKHVKS